MDITTTSEWQAAARATARHLRVLFAADPGRAARYTLDAGDLRIDFSKQLVDDEVMQALLAVQASGMTERRAAMFAGEAINTTEQRAVLHTALRAPREP